MDVYSLPLIITFVFILGTLIGSFVNVISLRYNTGLSLVSGRSKCINCNTELKWFDLVPVLSFLYLRGKCRNCHNKISLQYPIIELLTGFIFAGVALRQFYYFPLYSALPHGVFLSIFFFFYYGFVFSLLFVVLVYDLRHKIIPNSFVYTFIALSVIKLGLFFYCTGFVLTRTNIFDLLAPFILFIPFALLWSVSRGKWIGFGDAKLAFGIGALLGFVSGTSAIILAFWIGALFSLYLLYQSKTSPPGQAVTLQSEIPFAPFLIIAIIIVFFTHVDVLGLGTFLKLLQ